MSAHTFASDSANGLREVPDPGAAGVIRHGDISGICYVTTAGAEVRTLPAPSIDGISFMIVLVADGGDLTLTAVDLIGATVGGTFADVDDHLLLFSTRNATGGYEWSIISNNGVALLS